MNKFDLIQYSKLHKIFKPFCSGIGHVLLFHRVCTENNYILNNYLLVTQKYLENVLNFFISKNIDIVTLDECYNRITTNGKVKRFVTFTFDDGYADNLTHALPVFEKYNAPFAIFLTNAFPDYKIVCWWYLLENLVMNNDRIEFHENGIDYVYSTLTIDEKKDAFWKIRRFIIESSPENFFPRLKTVFNDIDLFDLTKKLALSWDQVSELSKHPLVTIGSHTVNHLALSKLTEEKAIHEISDSIKIIQGKIGKPVLYMAYPFGSSSEASVREFNFARNCGVKMAFTAIDGNIFSSHAKHILSLPRISIDESWRMSSIDLYINGLTPFVLKNFR